MKKAGTLIKKVPAFIILLLYIGFMICFPFQIVHFALNQSSIKSQVLIFSSLYKEV